jgi:hypothetical protein
MAGESNHFKSPLSGEKHLRHHCTSDTYRGADEEGCEDSADHLSSVCLALGTSDVESERTES